MSLKQIPQEIVLTASKFMRKKKRTMQHVIHEKLKKQETEKDSKILKKLCLELSRFVSAEWKYGLKEISELSDNMQRALLSIQRKKRKLFEKKKK